MVLFIDYSCTGPDICLYRKVDHIQAILEAKVQEFGNPSTSKLNKVGTGTSQKVQDP